MHIQKHIYTETVKSTVMEAPTREWRNHSEEHVTLQLGSLLSLPRKPQWSDLKKRKVEPVEPWLPPCSLRRMISVSEPKLFHAVQL